MHTKLALRLSDSIINSAKRCAREEGKSISPVVSDYLKAIAFRDRRRPPKAYGPITSRLKGSLTGRKIRLDDYHRHVEIKYL